MLRKLIKKLNDSVRSHKSPRRSISVPVTISIENNSGAIKLRRRATGKLVNEQPLPTLRGKTSDLSESGMAFIVPFIRLNENYLVGENTVLNVELDLPNGKINLQVVGQRYELLGKHDSATKYLIGARITRMSGDDREIYLNLLKNGAAAKSNRKPFAMGVTNS